MSEKAIIDGLTARNLAMHIEMVQMQETTLEFIERARTIKAHNTFLELRITQLERKLNEKVHK